MKKNKFFIGIGVLLVLVLGITLYTSTSKADGPEPTPVIVTTCGLTCNDQITPTENSMAQMGCDRRCADWGMAGLVMGPPSCFEGWHMVYGCTARTLQWQCYCV